MLEQCTIIGPTERLPPWIRCWIVSWHHRLPACSWKIATNWFAGWPVGSTSEWVSFTRWSNSAIEDTLLWRLGIFQRDWLSRDMFHTPSCPRVTSRQCAVLRVSVSNRTALSTSVKWRSPTRGKKRCWIFLSADARWLSGNKGGF